MVDDDLGWALGVIFRSYVKHSSALTEDLPGGHRGYQVLTAACADPPVNQSAIAQHLGIDRTVLTYLLDDLERAGLIVREPAPDDRRQRLIVATDGGRDRLAVLDSAFGRLESHVLAGLPAADRDTFRRLVGRVAAHLNGADPVPNTCAALADIAAATPDH